jgi:hypothetical protein
VVVVSEEPVDVTKQVPTSTVTTSETLDNIAAIFYSKSELVDQLHQQLASNSNKSSVVVATRGGYLGFFGVPLIPKNFKFFLPTTTFLYVKRVK